MPKARRTSSGSLTGSWPATESHPALGVRTVVSILIVVVLPAPLGPRKPKMTPASKVNEMWSTAVKPSKRLTRSRASMIAAVILPTIPLGRACPCDPLRCGLYGHPEPT